MKIQFFCPQNTMFSSPVLVNANEDFQNLRTLIVVVFALIVVPKYMAGSCSTPPSWRPLNLVHESRQLSCSMSLCCSSCCYITSLSLQLSHCVVITLPAILEVFISCGDDPACMPVHCTWHPRRRLLSQGGKASSDWWHPVSQNQYLSSTFLYSSFQQSPNA